MGEGIDLIADFLREVEEEARLCYGSRGFVHGDGVSAPIVGDGGLSGDKAEVGSLKLDLIYTLATAHRCSINWGVYCLHLPITISSRPCQSRGRARTLIMGNQIDCQEDTTSGTSL